jgi:hypothetical protein
MFQQFQITGILNVSIEPFEQLERLERLEALFYAPAVRCTTSQIVSGAVSSTRWRAWGAIVR